MYRTALALFLALAGLIPGVGASWQPGASSRHVVLISLDGFPAVTLADPRTPVPTLRRLAREGARARGFMPVNPVVTWPNHTTMVTGVRPAVHGVMWNGLLVRDPSGVPPRVEPWRPKDDMVRALTVYDAAHAKGLTTAQVDWVAIYGAKTITWAFPEVPSVDGTVEREMIAAGALTAEDVAGFQDATSGAWRDQRWTDAAVHIIERHAPNLLLFHLLALDSANHRYGPGTPASQTAMAFLDAQVERLLSAIDRAGLTAQTTVLIVSDHGFRSAEHFIHPNVVIRDAGLLHGTGNDLRAEAWARSWGGAAGVYVTDRQRREEVVSRLAPMLARLDGVDRVLRGAALTDANFPDPAALDQAPDLVLSAKRGFEFGGNDTGPSVTEVSPDHLGHHGALETDPEMEAIFIAWGEGVARGQSLDTVHSVQIAPTMAEWLGLTLPGAEGRSLANQLANGGAEAPPPQAVAAVIGAPAQSPAPGRQIPSPLSSAARSPSPPSPGARRAPSGSRDSPRPAPRRCGAP
jgi:predicted AlkP superfamily pyrophosphatase or phosphodiesterase